MGDPSSVLSAQRNFAIIIRQHNEGGGTFHCCQQAGNFEGGCDALGMGTLVFQRYRDESAQQGEPAPVQFFFEHTWISGHKAPISEFGTLVPGLTHFIEHQ